MAGRGRVRPGARLALLSTTTWAPPAQRWRGRGTRARTGGAVAVSDEVTRSWFTPGFAERRPDIVSRVVEEFEATGRAGYAGCCEAIAALDQRVMPARVRAPAVVISAAHDPETPPGHGRRLANALPGSRFEVVSGAAHLVNIERADRVNELLMEHIAP